MKAVTLHQPWASLVALKVKTIETRSWPCPPSLIGQPLAIHAGAREPGPQRPGVAMRLGPWATWWAHAKAEPGWTLQPEPECSGGVFPLPLGAVVATCRVAACVPMVDAFDAKARHQTPFLTISRSEHQFLALWRDEPDTPTMVTDQLPYGDFRPGRFAWLLEDVKPSTDRCPACWGEGAVREAVAGEPSYWSRLCSTCGGAGHCPPVPARGRQRVWNWEP